MLLIYVEVVTERLIYTFDFVFKDRAIDFKISNDPYYFNSYLGPKLNYSDRKLDNILQIAPSKVLFDDVVFPYYLEVFEFHYEPCFSFDSILDPFASIFYVLSRMEEYTQLKRDEHDRFSAKESVLSKYGMLQKVMCDRWSEAVISFLETKLRIQLHALHIPVAIIPTFDIDNTYAFKWKQNWRRILSSAKDWTKRDTERLRRRKAVLFGSEKDPYDTFDEIIRIAQRGFQVKLFWLLGDYARFDKNISSMDQRHRKLIQEMAKTVEIGLHPSYKSNEAQFYLEREKDRIERILGHEVTFSRQHFLKINLPVTYQNLIKKQFTADYSMGFADDIGFRAGTARSFDFFDLSKNLRTNYRIHPFAYMDGTLNEYKKWTIAESKQKIQELYTEVAHFGGDFICIWHNETIGNFAKWEGWREVLDFTLNLGAAHEMDT